MEPITLAVLGVGNVRYTPRVLATLAGYFGERHMRIVLYDPDEERLDLFHRLARSFFAFAKSTHELDAIGDPDEALANADLVIVQLEENAARKILKVPRGRRAPNLAKAVQITLANLSPTAETLCLLEPGVQLPVRRYRRLEWGPPLTEAERVAVPHQSLRWIHGEDYPFEIMAECEQSPLKAWLEDPSTAQLVGEG